MIDLHTHSRISDGSESPAVVVELAKAAGCSALALTDHDRFDGLAEARKERMSSTSNWFPGWRFRATGMSARCICWSTSLTNGPPL